MVKPVVRQVQTQEGVLIIDDSIEEKPFTDENELVTWHYSHTSGTTVKGINFLTALYYTGTISVPVGLELVTKDQITENPKTGKTTKNSTLTKNERYRKLLEAGVKNHLTFQYVLNDVWFASAENMRYVKLDLGKDFVMPLKKQSQAGLEFRRETAWPLPISWIGVARTGYPAGDLLRASSFPADVGQASLYKQRWQHRYLVTGNQ